MTHALRGQLSRIVDGVVDELEPDLQGELLRACLQAFPAKPGDAGGSKDPGRTQLNQVERIALSSTRLGDVVAFVKRQTGRRPNKKTWAKSPRDGTVKDCLGAKLVAFLNKLKETASRHCQDEGFDEHRGEVAVLAAGKALRNLNSLYLYERVMKVNGAR